MKKIQIDITNPVGHLLGIWTIPILDLHFDFSIVKFSIGMAIAVTVYICLWWIVIFLTNIWSD